MASKQHLRPALVLDASVALAWCFADEADPYADAIAGSFARVQGVVPPLWHLEVANALLMGERRKRSLPADTTQWLGYLRSLPIVVDEDAAKYAWSDILILARSCELSSYDAAYLELAIRRRLPLATLDRRLRKAAKAAGIALYTV